MAIGEIMIFEFEKWNSSLTVQRREIIELRGLEEVPSARFIREWERHDKVVKVLCSSYLEFSEFIP
jgi:hypothetical protein